MATQSVEMMAALQARKNTGLDVKKLLKSQVQSLSSCATVLKAKTRAKELTALWKDQNNEIICACCSEKYLLSLRQRLSWLVSSSS